MRRDWTKIGLERVRTRYKGGTSTNTVQNADPWTGVQPYLLDLFGRAQRANRGTPRGFFQMGPGYESTMIGAQKGYSTKPAGSDTKTINLGQFGSATVPAGATGASGGDQWEELPTITADTYAGPTKEQKDIQNAIWNHAWNQYGQLGQPTQQAVGALTGLLNQAPAGQGMFDVSSLPQLNLDKSPSYSALAPNYSQFTTGSELTKLLPLKPDYSQQFQSTVEGVTKPLTYNFVNNVMPALQSAQALTGGSSSRHRLQGLDALKTYSDSIGEAVARKGLDLSGLDASNFSALTGAAASEAAGQRGVRSSDYGVTASQMGQDYRANSQITAADLAKRMELAQTSYEQAKNRALDWAKLNAGTTLGAASALPGIEQSGYNLGLTPLQTMGGMADLTQGWNQASLDDMFRRYQMNQGAPWQGLDQYSGILQGLAGLGGTSSTSQTSSGASGAANFLKGGIGAAGLSGALGITPFLTNGAVFNAGMAGTGGLGGMQITSALNPWLLAPFLLGGLASSL